MARIYHADFYRLRRDRASTEIDERYPAVEGAVLDLDERPAGPVSPGRSS